MNKSRIIVALDFPEANQALEFCSKIDSKNCKIKVGKELYTKAGPILEEKFRSKGFEIFKEEEIDFVA